MSLAMRPNEVNTEVQYDCKVRRQAVIFFIYCRRAEYEENSTPVLEGDLKFLYASSLFWQKYKAHLSLEMGFVSNLRMTLVVLLLLKKHRISRIPSSP